MTFFEGMRWSMDLPDPWLGLRQYRVIVRVILLLVLTVFAVGGTFILVRRDRLVISSKVFWPMGDSPNDRGLSRSHIHASIEGTLARLAVDHLDLYYCHREDPSVPLDETVRAMSDLCAQVKIRAWGTSCWRPSTLREACHIAAAGGWTPPRVEQSQYSLMVREIENDLVSCCRQLGMALVAFSPMAGGVLTGKYLDGVPSRSRAAESSWLDSFLQPEMVERVCSFVTWCGSTQQDPAAVALAWVMEQPGVASAICGASNVDQMSSNLLAEYVSLGRWEGLCIL